MPPVVTEQSWAQDTSPPPIPQEPFVFYRPQYHNGLLNNAERLNERRIRMAMMAHGDGPSSICKLSPARLRELMAESQARADSAGMDAGVRNEIYVKHEELEHVAELIYFRETYADKLVAYCHQKVQPRMEITVPSVGVVDLNKKE